jgi:hypothetical protein
VVTGNTANENAGTGISVGSGVTVSGNSASRNGSNGIVVGLGATVIGNAAYDNTGMGLFAGGTRVGYSQNVFVGNNGGDAHPQVTNGINSGHNVCGTDAVCP